MTTELPAPAGLGERGTAFWRGVTAVYELGIDEIELLTEICRALDMCNEIQAAIERDGYTVEGSEGQPRVHPGISQLNSTRTLLSRLMAQLSLPDEDGSTLSSPARVRAQKASGQRWANRPKGSAVSDAASKAASARWRRNDGA